MLCYQFNVRVCVLHFLCHCLGCKVSQRHVTIIYCPQSVIFMNCLGLLLYHCCIREHSTIALGRKVLFDNPDKILTVTRNT